MHKEISNLYKDVTKYVEQCINDAMRSTDDAENRPRHWFIFIGDDMIFDLNFSSEIGKAEKTVAKKILWRLNWNVKKHFNLEFFAPNFVKEYGEFLSDMYSFTLPDEFSYNYALAKVEVFDQILILCGKFDNRPEDEDATTIIKDGGLEVFSRPTWEEFYNAYIKAFGNDPRSVWAMMRKGEDPNQLDTPEYISKKAESDLKTFGCKYFSVCKDACKSCIASDRCLRKKPIMKDGLVLSRYRDFKMESLMGKYKNEED